MTTSLIDSLSPELQTEIMRNLGALASLHSLIRASPRFLQVFRSRKQYLLTQIASQDYHPSLADDLRKLGRASQIGQYPTTEQLGDCHYAFQTDEFWDSPFVLSPLEAAAIHRLSPTIAWFIDDYKTHTLTFLENLADRQGFSQNSEVLYSDLSDVEYGRMQRAFVRIETFKYLFHTRPETSFSPVRTSLAKGFLETYSPDEVEEIACIRDYIVRRLWGVFEDVEDDALLEETLDHPIQQLGALCRPHRWFSENGKHYYLKYMEYIMSCGLPFVKEVILSSGFQRAFLVISNSFVQDHYLSKVIRHWRTYGMDPNEKPDYYDGLYDDGEGEYVGEAVDNISQGLLWANRLRIPADYARPQLKGLRDWGYVFWSRERLQASGVLDKE
ncbi:MAG: hypothetical protein Q9183_002177 [Haloplaca sp. 2 TL-2023]